MHHCAIDADGIYSTPENPAPGATGTWDSDLRFAASITTDIYFRNSHEPEICYEVADNLKKLVYVSNTVQIRSVAVATTTTGIVLGWVAKTAQKLVGFVVLWGGWEFWGITNPDATTPVRVTIEAVNANTYKAISDPCSMLSLPPLTTTAGAPLAHVMANDCRKEHPRRYSLDSSEKVVTFRSAPPSDEPEPEPEESEGEEGNETPATGSPAVPTPPPAPIGIPTIPIPICNLSSTQHYFPCRDRNGTVTVEPVP